MKIIIVGDGKVGFTLAEHLSQEEHDITVIDTNDAALRHASEALDVMCVKGNGASISALRESGVDAADVLIAATSMDEVNMVCCLTAFFRLLGRHNPRCRNVFLVGGGRIAHYLTAILERLGIHVKIIERSLDRCRHLSEVLPKATVICGDGTDQELLEEEDVTASDAFVALTDRDEDNLIISLYAMQQGIPKVVAKSNRQNYAGIAHAAGLDSVISPKLLTAGQILQVVRGMQNSKGSVMNALYKIADGHAEAMEFVANATTRNRDTPLRELRLKPGILVAVLVHQGRIVIPDGSSSIAAGDTVIVISRNHGILDLNDIFEDSLLELGGDA